MVESNTHDVRSVDPADKSDDPAQFRQEEFEDKRARMNDVQAPVRQWLENGQCVCSRLVSSLWDSGTRTPRAIHQIVVTLYLMHIYTVCQLRISHRAQ
jgi:hypothetical protein